MMGLGPWNCRLSREPDHLRLRLAASPTSPSTPSPSPNCVVSTKPPQSSIPSKTSTAPTTAPARMDRLYRLLDFVHEKINKKEKNNLSVSLGVWRKREVFVVNYIIGHHLSHKEFGVCLSLMKDLLSRDSSDPILSSQLGYIQLQTGDLEGVKVSFLKVEDEGKSNESSLSEVKNLVSRNKALVHTVEKDYVSAVSTSPSSSAS